MTQLSDLQLSERLAALRVPPPDGDFRERLLGNLRALDVAPSSRARLLHLAARRRRPVAVLALGALGFAGAAAAALDGHVWQALRAIAAPAVAPPAPTPPARRRAREPVQNAAAKPDSPAAAPAGIANPPGANEPAALVQPAATAAPAASTNPPAPATSPTPRSAGAARAGHGAGSNPNGHERRSPPAEHEPPSTRGSSPAPAHLAVPRVDLTDLPGDHADHGEGPRASSERSRDARDDMDAAHGARDRAAEARERAADHRPSDRARRIDSPLLDVDHERKTPDAREREDHDRDSHGDRARPERDR